ncbi:hypothetical protein DLJ53_15300 [Acuticoccus sediminis]|uniref:GGDEF domain-containing protein n=1 Tax=Acuticoccus sediminis TaxID=2184697 RepID=A0A8B2NPM6_9HYPH|nr:hypothetical protein [Acuticoccus sediminis]RAI00622.1 hypothetical protein DLJ53_15300 [Acuticoccus sediminis]
MAHDPQDSAPHRSSDAHGDEYASPPCESDLAEALASALSSGLSFDDDDEPSAGLPDDPAGGETMADAGDSGQSRSEGTSAAVGDVRGEAEALLERLAPMSRTARFAERIRAASDRPEPTAAPAPHRAGTAMPRAIRPTRMPVSEHAATAGSRETERRPQRTRSLALENALASAFGAGAWDALDEPVSGGGSNGASAERYTMSATPRAPVHCPAYIAGELMPPASLAATSPGPSDGAGHGGPQSLPGAPAAGQPFGARPCDSAAPPVERVPARRQTGAHGYPAATADSAAGGHAWPADPAGRGAAAFQSERPLLLRDARRIWMSAPAKRIPHTIAVMSLRCPTGLPEAAATLRRTRQALIEALDGLGHIYAVAPHVVAVVFPDRALHQTERIAEAVRATIDGQGGGRPDTPLLLACGIAALHRDDDPTAAICIAEHCAALAEQANESKVVSEISPEARHRTRQAY